MPERSGTRAEKEARERVWLDFLVEYVNKRISSNPVVAVAHFTITIRNFAPYDLIAASAQDRRTFRALRLVVWWLWKNEPIALLASPLLLWTIAVVDGTWPVPPGKEGRPSKGHELFRNHVIAVIVDEIAAIGLRRPCARARMEENPSASASHLVAGVLGMSPQYVCNIWSEHHQVSR